MKKLLLNLCLIVLFLALSANSAIALRCGNDLIREGDTIMKVMNTLKKNDGEIVEKKHVGAKGDGTINSRNKGHNTSGSYTTKTKKIEKLFIKIRSGYGRPYCYELTFVSSILKEIGSAIDCE